MSAKRMGEPSIGLSSISYLTHIYHYPAYTQLSYLQLGMGTLMVCSDVVSALTSMSVLTVLSASM